MFVGQHLSQHPAAGFPRQSILHAVQPHTPAVDAAAAGSVAGFLPVPSARLLSFNAAAAGSYNSQAAAAAAAAGGHNSTGRDSAFDLHGADDAEDPQQQQQRRRPRQQQQRRRRQRAAAASDDDSDYLAAEDVENSADYELSDDGYSYEERLPAHRSARAPRGFSGAVPAAASGSGGAQQYPQQLPQFYKSQRWSPAEHAKLVELVAKHGLRNWAVVAAELPGRNGKQCRERYLTHAAKAKRVSPGCCAYAILCNENDIHSKPAYSRVYTFVFPSFVCGAGSLECVSTVTKCEFRLCTCSSSYMERTAVPMS
jgi:hypothetical protein